MKFRLRDFAECLINGQEIWFIENKMHCIVKYIMGTQKTIIVDILPKELQKSFSIGKLVKKDNIIYLIPIWADDVYYYDLDSRHFSKLNISFSQIDGICSRKRMVVIDAGEYIYCINSNPDFIVKINHNTKRHELFNLKLHQCKNEDIQKSNVLSVANWLDKNGEIYFVYGKNILLKFNTINNTFFLTELSDIICEFNEKINIYDCIVTRHRYRDSEIFCTFFGKVYIKENNVLKKLDIFTQKKESFKEIENRYIWDSVIVHNRVYFFCAYSTLIIRYNIENKEIMYIDNPFELGNEVNGYQIVKKIDDKSIFFWSYRTKNTYILYIENECINKIDIEIELGEYSCSGIQNVNYLLNNNMFIIDNLDIMLSETKNDLIIENTNFLKKSIGSKIYEVMTM